jgi:hypothetical protein
VIALTLINTAATIRLFLMFMMFVFFD